MPSSLSLLSYIHNLTIITLIVVLYAHAHTYTHTNLLIDKLIKSTIIIDNVYLMIFNFKSRVYI